jgi:hypothetical protein
MTSGAFCACAAGAINCTAVRAVVASSSRRTFVMMGEISEEFPATRRAINE